ncbi:hypothetical protein Ga0123461_0568 [Mariprofundus aestuarium]|uniref:Serine aminopeptidase S33 domain-containing protein n=2 Tax=Mariprofundus aestuarium TaxID=1921086 RepID=A0A2K8KW38_MARES|nr:hypothetical protein Ga0123461_0568 [Mariprofundus aestuarium]
MLLSFAGASGYMALFEDNYIYFPAREVSSTPAYFGMQFEELHVTTTDGITLHGWYMPVPSSRFTVLHLHGNAGNISHRLSLYRQWQAMGLSVYAIDYRGYGKSEGEPGEAGLYADARAAWRDATTRLGLKPESVIIAGRSLGAAVAAKLAREVKAAGLALETPFSNIPDMASFHYPWLPLRWLAKSRFDAMESVKDVYLPLLLIAARDDSIAPAWMAEKVFAAANEPKKKVELAGGHNDFDHYSFMAYAVAWREWIGTLGTGGAGDIPRL